MCGIAGAFDLIGRRPIAPARLRRMTNRLAHRGPDGGDAHLEPGVALGHRRLAIIDLAGGRQPLFNEDGRIVLICNGEIYNHHELREELRARGHNFRTGSDCEVIVHGWEEWGEDCLSRLKGMFALALWDGRGGTLLLARDRLGEKPLYWTRTPDGLLLFASELPALLAGLDEEPEIDPLAVEDYMAFGYVPDPRTIRRGVFKLAPGHRLLLAPGRPAAAPVAWWDLRFEPRGTEPAPEELLERLRGSVRGCLESEVPLGAFLSGGVDSSAVVGCMAEALSTSVRTCSIGFSDPRFDESAHAARVAGIFGTRHACDTVEVDAASLIDRLAEVYGEPFADDSALPTYLLCGMARRQVTVALSGDGGDEVFAGYPRYLAHAREERAKGLLPAALRRPVFGALARSYPKLDWAPRWLRGKSTFEALAADAAGGWFRAVTLAPTPLRHRLLSGDALRALDGYTAEDTVRLHATRAGTNDPIARAQYVDIKLGLAGDMLVKVDRASMAHGLEVRAPMLDHTLVEWAASLPTAAKVGGGTGKSLLKKAIEPWLPREVIYRRKQGFSTPLAGWLRGGLSERVRAAVDRSPLTESGLFDAAALKRCAAEHASGLRDHGRVLWSLLMFDAFLRTGTAAAMPAAAE
ncbi:XrtA/PEP-CTERM system amidotransferase [Arenibaculum pallidiluteum]|uniref:XrtA/PEP-CTERM system amidotransferase n=1 Tax=Arenibaculum pallidiluteum TaxID=2812559 RepID=UPI001A97ABD5|nr:XrtA/PEP-CTERM system amidotransferase [Arenibaculum pallidiluteum]